jgi:hypothetical protein
LDAGYHRYGSLASGVRRSAILKEEPRGLCEASNATNDVVAVPVLGGLSAKPCVPEVRTEFFGAKDLIDAVGTKPVAHRRLP